MYSIRAIMDQRSSVRIIGKLNIQYSAVVLRTRHALFYVYIIGVQLGSKEIDLRI